jgi:chaperonin cofactor prefoldin
MRALRRARLERQQREIRARIEALEEQLRAEFLALRAVERELAGLER